MMHEQPEEIQVEPDFDIYQNSQIRGDIDDDNSRTDYIHQEEDEVQLCNQPWIDDPYQTDYPDEEEEQQRTFGQQQRKRKLSKIIVLDSDDEEDDNINNIDYGDDPEDNGKDENGDVILIDDEAEYSGGAYGDGRFNSTTGGDDSSSYINYYSEQQNSGVRLDPSAAYECHLCGKRVASSYNLKRHMMIHTGERPFGCDICDKRFREFSDLKKHRRVHIADPNFKCMVCMVNAPAPTNPTKCLDCDRSKFQGPPPSSYVISPSSSASSTQQISNNRKSAGNATNSNNSFVVNSVVVDNDSSSSSVNAPLASNLANAQDIQEFQYTEDGVGKKGYNCPICDRIFGSRHNLKRHFMIHTGEKPYPCKICDRSFREFSTLKKHTLTHMRMKFYNCEICHEEFNNYGSYTAHTLTHSNEAAAQNDNNYQYEQSLSDANSNNGDLIIPNDPIEIVDCNPIEDSVEQTTRNINIYRPNTFHCYVCKRIFKDEEKLNSHLIIHKNEANEQSEIVKEENNDIYSGDESINC